MGVETVLSLTGYYSYDTHREWAASMLGWDEDDREDDAADIKAMMSKKVHKRTVNNVPVL